MKSSEKKMLLAKYEEYKQRDPSTAIRFVLAWYKGWHRISTGKEITEEEEKEIRDLLTLEKTEVKKKKEQKKKPRKKQKKA